MRRGASEVPDRIREAVRLAAWRRVKAHGWRKTAEEAGISLAALQDMVSVGGSSLQVLAGVFPDLRLDLTGEGLPPLQGKK